MNFIADELKRLVLPLLALMVFVFYNDISRIVAG